MGGTHTRVASAHPGCTLLGIFDTDLACAEQVGRQYEVNVYSALDELCAQVDAVIIATPAATHGEVAAACLQAGRHVLLEKPMTATVDEARTLAALSRQMDRVFMVGHVERYNPAVTVLLSLLDPSALFSCDIQRLSPAPGHDLSVNIIFDLMIHDLDLVLAYTRSPVVAVTAVGQSIRSTTMDHVSALVRFANGATATLITSWVSHERLRAGRLFTRDVQYLIDYANRELRVLTHDGSTLTTRDGHTVRANRLEQVQVPYREPLAAELDHFCQAIHTGTPPLTGADSSVRAVELAYAVHTAASTHETVCCNI